jgi:ComF family protein
VTGLVDSGWDRLLGCLLPPRCVLCGRPGQPPCHDLCPGCDAGLPRLASALDCNDSIGGRITAACDRSFAMCAYAPPVDALVQALKYAGQLALGRVLGRLLARQVAELGLHLDVDCVLPVPLHPRRYAERGFNQSAEIACFAARALQLPFAPTLAARRRETRPQVGLSPADRHANMHEAFVAVPGDVRARRIVIVDDVITTGSTVAALASALKQAGAVSVDVWCIARATPATGSASPGSAGCLPVALRR